MAMIDVSTLKQVVEAVVIALGALFAVAELRDLAKDRKTQLVMNVWSTWMSSDFAEAHSKIEENTIEEMVDLMQKCSNADLLKVSYFYEGLGLMVQKRLVSPDLVLEMSRARTMWAKIKPWMADRRNRLGPLTGEHFEYLAKLDAQYKARRLTDRKAG